MGLGSPIPPRRLWLRAAVFWVLETLWWAVIVLAGFGVLAKLMEWI